VFQTSKQQIESWTAQAGRYLIIGEDHQGIAVWACGYQRKVSAQERLSFGGEDLPPVGSTPFVSCNHSRGTLVNPS